MIPPRNLSLLSNRLAKAGGRRIPESVLERDYCLAWFLIGLSRTKMRETLAFKGGTALKRCYFGDYRFSEDLDFTLMTEMEFDTMRQELDIIFAEVRQAAQIEFGFAGADRQSHSNSHTFYLSYNGPLPTQAGNRVKVDVTIREQIVFRPEPRPVLRGYDEYEDLPGNAKIRVYPLKEIAAEKVVALMTKARNEPRDLFDIWYLLDEGHIDLRDVLHAVEKKWEFRGKNMADVRKEFATKEARYRKLWIPRLSAQVINLPEFETVYRAVHRSLRQSGVIGK